LLQELLRPALPALAGGVSPALARFRRLTMHCKALAFVTMVSGAFVAGLDAGGTLAPFSYLRIFFPSRSTLKKTQIHQNPDLQTCNFSSTFQETQFREHHEQASSVMKEKQSTTNFAGCFHLKLILNTPHRSLKVSISTPRTIG
jgi:hypothetical protein